MKCETSIFELQSEKGLSLSNGKQSIPQGCSETEEELKALSPF
jgi:hypothetical protein